MEAGTSQAANSVESELADIEDLLSYANDVLNTGLILPLLQFSKIPLYIISGIPKFVRNVKALLSSRVAKSA